MIFADKKNVHKKYRTLTTENQTGLKALSLKTKRPRKANPRSLKK